MKMYYDYTADAEEQRLIVVLEGTKASFSWQGSSLQLNRSKGVRYLVELLLHPYMNISASSLYALVNHDASPVGASWGIDEQGIPAVDGFHSILPQPLCDPQTIRDIRLRLNILTVCLEEAEQWNDLGKREEMKLERDALLDYLKDSLSAGRNLESSSDADYKCSDAVYNALNYTLKNLAKQNPALEQLLRKSLHLWERLMFIPADNLSVMVLEN